jgi:Periplasmic component of the Tol biopolymer transport system
MKRLSIIFVAALPVLLCLAAGCAPSQTHSSEEYPEISPDYVGVTVPEGMCEMPFKMADGRQFKKSVERFGDTLLVTVTAWKKGDGSATKYRPFPIYISHDEIDPFIAYRLIEPGYESWRYMGIYQRELASFKETPIVTNRMTNLGCVNCHSFHQGDPSHLLFHARGAGGGTIFASEADGVKKIDLTKIGPGRQGVYPQWHPQGRYVAFSSNTTYQDFHIKHEQPLEVFDMASDLIILDTQTMEVTEYATADKLETFPCWSADGSRLFYCAADSVAQLQDNKGLVHYRLMAREFRDGKLSDEAVELFGDDSCSVSFPRVFGDKMMLTIAEFGTFPIWHKEADLWMLDLATGEARALDEINSDDTESYHSWSSNGKWIVFSSRRIDGRYTRLFIAHRNNDGTFDKPFQLPQKNADFDELRLKSYNIPEFVKGEVADYRKQVKKLF